MYDCLKCDKSFINNFLLQRHLKRKIPCDRIIQCIICLQKFKTLQLLNKHENRQNKKCYPPDIIQRVNELKNEIKGINEVKKIKLKYEYGGFIYILSNINNEAEHIYKIGITENLKSRLNSYNTGMQKHQHFYYCSQYHCSDPVNLEKYIFSKLKKFKIENVNEMYKLQFEKLDNIIKNICRNDLSITNGIDKL